MEKDVLGSCKVSLDIFLFFACFISIFICFLNFQDSKFFSGLINFLKLMLITLLYKFLLIPKIFVSNSKLCPLKVGLYPY